MAIVIPVNIELTEAQAEALLAWQDTPYTGCTPVYPSPLTQAQRSLIGMKLIEASSFPMIGAYRITDLGRQVRAKLMKADPGDQVRYVYPRLKAGIVNGHGVYAVNHIEGAEVFVRPPDGSLYRLLNVAPGAPWPKGERVCRGLLHGLPKDGPEDEASQDDALDALAQTLYWQMRHLEPERTERKDWADMTEFELGFYECCAEHLANSIGAIVRYWKARGYLPILEKVLRNEGEV